MCTIRGTARLICETIENNIFETVLHSFFFFGFFLVKFCHSIPRHCPWSLVLLELSLFWSFPSAAVCVLAAACTRCAVNPDVSNPPLMKNQVFNC